MTIALTSRNDSLEHAAFIRDFKASMALNASAVAAICCEHDGIRYGLAATSVTSLSVDPPSMLICVGQKAEAHDPIMSAGCFSINFLAGGQSSISERLAGFAGEKNEAKFQDAPWSRGHLGMPILADCAFAVECEISHSFKVLTHTLHAGTVRAIWRNGNLAPLVYFNRSYIDLTQAA
jgi:flavin reductase (DIM6/NTAB) family NADH-FMN oxidoreductase RutF